MPSTKFRSFSIVFISSFIATLAITLGFMYFFLYTPRLEKLAAGTLPVVTEAENHTTQAAEIPTPAPTPEPGKAKSTPKTSTSISGGKNDAGSETQSGAQLTETKKRSSDQATTRRRKTGDRVKNSSKSMTSSKPMTTAPDSSSKGMAGKQPAKDVSGGVNDPGNYQTESEYADEEEYNLGPNQSMQNQSGRRPATRTRRGVSKVSGRRGDEIGDDEDL